MGKDYLQSFLADDEYFDVFRRRGRQELPEMDSCRDIAAIVARICKEFNPNWQSPSILDIPCATGYLYHSLQKVVTDFTYTGVDISERNIAEAREIFSDCQDAKFHVGDLYEFESEKYDVVICANTLCNLPNASLALERLASLTKKTLILRTPVGEISLSCRMSHDDVFNSDGVPDGHFYYYNIYTRSYLETVLRGLQFRNIEFIEPGAVSSNLVSHASLSFPEDRKGTTRVIEGRQVASNLILDWRTIVGHL